MDPQQPTPTVEWAPPEAATPPKSGEPVGALHNNRPPSTFTIGDAITTGIGLVGKPSFIVPVLAIGIVVNFVIELALRPFITTTFDPAARLGADQLGALAGPIIISILLGIVGGILINLYGQIWAVQATSGPLPQPGSVFALAGSRWVGVIGTGIAVAILMIGLFLVLLLVTGAITAALGNAGILAFLAMLVGVIWVSARLSMAGWLAADGLSISNSINGSWRITSGNTLRIIGWSLGYGLVFAIIGAILAAILAFVPTIGPAIAQSISLAFGYGAGVTLYRRTQAAASPPARTTAPVVSTAEM